MSDLKTDREEVVRLARLLRWPQDEAPWRMDCELAAEMLEALLSQRDAALAAVEAPRREERRIRRGWLATIQTENSCPATGGGCLAKRCGCVEEMEMLMREDDARGEAKEPGHG